MFSDPSFWVFAAFVIFVAFLVYRKVPAQAAAAIDKRRHEIAEEFRQSRALHEEARALLAKAGRKLKKAERDAAAIVAEAEKEAENLKRDMQVAFERRLKHRRDMAEARIARAEDAARRELNDALIALVVDSTRELLETRLASEQDDRLIERGIDAVIARLDASQASAGSDGGRDDSPS